MKGAPLVVTCTYRSTNPNEGGPARSIPRLCAALREAGVHVTLVTTEAVPSPEQALRAAVQPGSVVHDNGLWIPLGVQARRAARRAHAPRVVSPRGMLTPWALRQHRLKKTLAWHLYQRRMLASATVLHATSDAEGLDIRRLGFRMPIAVLPNGVDLPAQITPAPPGPRRALFLSRFHPGKGALALVEAWAAVRPPGWELVLAGPDVNGHRDEVAARVEALGLWETVQLHPEVTDADRNGLLATAELFVLPSVSENFGMAIAEALAAGRPVITTTGTPWQVLRDEACGWWIAPTEAAALTDALRAATRTSPGELAAMGMRGRRYVERSLSWGQVARDFATLYRWMLGQAERPSFVHLD